MTKKEKEVIKKRFKNIVWSKEYYKGIHTAHCDMNIKDDAYSELLNDYITLYYEYSDMLNELHLDYIIDECNKACSDTMIFFYNFTIDTHKTGGSENE